MEIFNNLNIEKKVLFDLAASNLNAIINDISSVNMNGIFGIAAGGSYEASLILLKNRWRSNFLPVDGDYVIGVPTRDQLYVTGSNNIKGISVTRSVVNKAYKQGHYKVSPHLYKFNGEKFERFN